MITSQWTSNQSPSASDMQTPKGVDGTQGGESPPKRKRTKLRNDDQKRQKRIKIVTVLNAVSDWSPPTSVKLADLGGIDDCIQEVLELIVMPLKHPELYTHTGIQPPR